MGATKSFDVRGTLQVMEKTKGTEVEGCNLGWKLAAVPAPTRGLEDMKCGQKNKG